jgi:hypothetical protein
MKRLVAALAICFLVFGTPEKAFSARGESKIVVRVDAVTVKASGKTLVIRVQGMGRTPGKFAVGGRLVPRNPEKGLNKEGLLEYELQFNPQPGYSGFNLRIVKATYKERSLPQGVKGVRVFGEYNYYDGLIPEPKKKKPLLPSFRRHNKSAGTDDGSDSITGSSPRP